MTSIEYENFLTEFFKGFRRFELEKFKRVLKESKAIIAGGSIARLFVEDKSNFKETDIDIYVNIKDSKSLIDEMKYQFERITNEYRASGSYDSSFLTRNNIYRVLNFTKTISDKETKVQIMLVRNSETVLNVVKNFDLTCCQCWYDGEETLTSGVTELFVCVDDETPSFELLDDGTYTLESGVTFDVFEGVYTI